LSIPDRNYGLTLSAAEPALESVTALSEEASNKQANSPIAQESSGFNDLPIARLILLVVCVTLLIGIMVWRYRGRAVAKNVAHTAHSSSSYLPLTQKPGETMDKYVDRETD